MISLDASLDALLKRVYKNKEKMETTITQARQKLTAAVFQDVVRLTPQFTGNLASNWKIEVHNERKGYKKISNYRVNAWRNVKQRYVMGDNPAVGRSFMELSEIPKIRWNSRIRIVNYTPYGQDVEDGTIVLRPENTINGEVAMTKYVATKYRKMSYARIKGLVNK